jgi:hypothetical protein
MTYSQFPLAYYDTSYYRQGLDHKPGSRRTGQSIDIGNRTDELEKDAVLRSGQ